MTLRRDLCAQPFLRDEWRVIALEIQRGLFDKIMVLKWRQPDVTPLTKQAAHAIRFVTMINTWARQMHAANRTLVVLLSQQVVAIGWRHSVLSHPLPIDGTRQPWHGSLAITTRRIPSIMFAPIFPKRAVREFFLAFRALLRAVNRLRHELVFVAESFGECTAARLTPRSDAKTVAVASGEVIQWLETQTLRTLFHSSIIA